MLAGVDIGIIHLSKSKIDAVLKGHRSLVNRTTHIKDFVAQLHNNRQVEISHPMPIQGKNPSTQHLHSLKFNKLKISFLKEFNGIWSKF